MDARREYVFARPSTRSFLDTSFRASVADGIAQSKLISFDIFDTLLRRPYLSPKDIFIAMEEGNRNPGFAERRTAAECAARIRHADRPEITLDDIYAFLDEDPAKELESELKAIYPRADILGWLFYARKQGKKIVAVSDMYLPKHFIANLLRKHQIPHDDLIVSAAEQATKHAGTAFRLLAQRHHVEFREILHFGDDTYSDHYVPQKLGIRTVLVSNGISPGMADAPVGTLIGDLKKGTHHSSMLGSVTRDLTFTEQPAEFWNMVGRYYAAPLALAYAQWIHRHMECHGLDRVAFVARDGYLPMEAFRHLAPKTSARYLHLSRAIVLRAGLDAPSDLVLKNLVAGSKTNVSNFITRLGDDTSDLLSVARAHFGGDPVVGTDVSTADLAAFFTANHARLRTLSESTRPLLLRYLAQHGMLDRPEKIAVADVGWNGTAAAMLADIVPETRYWKWLYVGSTPHHHPESPPHRAMYFQYGQPREHFELIHDCVEIFEFLFSAPEPTAIALQEQGARIEPVFAAPESRWPGWEPRVKAIHDGVRNALPAYLEAINRHGLQINTDSFTRILASLMRTQDPVMLKEFSAIEHQCGLGGSAFFPLLPAIDHKDYWSNVLRLAKGKKLKGKGGLVYWNSQYERHFLAQLSGPKSYIARKALQIRNRRAARKHA
jgi:FMN phosphatase YigB (HAD superfamily)